VGVLSRLISGEASRARITWRRDRRDRDSASVKVELREGTADPPGIRLTLAAGSPGKSCIIRQDVQACLTAQRRGNRLWFLCPACDRQCGVLYLKPGERTFRCRVCGKLVYRSQRGTSSKSRPGSLSPEETVGRAHESIRKDLSDVISAVCARGARSSPKASCRQASAGETDDHTT